MRKISFLVFILFLLNIIYANEPTPIVYKGNFDIVMLIFTEWIGVLLLFKICKIKSNLFFYFWLLSLQTSSV